MGCDSGNVFSLLSSGLYGLGFWKQKTDLICVYIKLACLCFCLAFLQSRSFSCCYQHISSNRITELFFLKNIMALVPTFRTQKNIKKDSCLTVAVWRRSEHPDPVSVWERMLFLCQLTDIFPHFFTRLPWMAVVLTEQSHICVPDRLSLYFSAPPVWPLALAASPQAASALLSV